MRKAKFIISTLLFAFLLLLTTNVNAEVVSYGYVTCNYECSAKHTDGMSITTETATCSDRWDEKHQCKNADGSFVDSATIYDNSFSINFGADGNIISVGVDLFGKGASNYSQHQYDIDKFNIKKTDDNVFIYYDKTMLQDNDTVDTGLFSQTYYIHDYRPIVEYFKKSGKYPEIVVADYESDKGFFQTIGYTSWLKYTYYPSDYKTTEHKFNSYSQIQVVDNTLKFYNEESDTLSVGGGHDYCKRIDITDARNAQDLMNCMSYTTGSGTIHRFFARNVSSDNILACDDMEADFNYIKKLYDEFGTDNTEFQNASKKFLDDCENYMGKTHKNASSLCSSCQDKMDELTKMDPDLGRKTNYCGFGDDMVAWLLRALKILRYIVPILVIVLSIFDYISAIMSDQDDAIKKAGGRLGKRLFIMIIFLVMPSILQFLLNVFKVDGLSSSNPYCLKK